MCLHGSFWGTVLALDDTLKVIAYEDIFWTAT